MIRPILARVVWGTILFLFAGPVAAADVPAGGVPGRKTENVFLVTLDGMRWQEVFGGLDADTLAKGGTPKDPARIRKEYGRPTPEARREALMPFLWTVVAKQGQIFGDPAAGSPAKVSNGLKFSYPGYSEMLCGFPDPRINSNNDFPNPNLTVLEFLNRRPGFEGKVAAYGTWDRLTAITNAPRSGFFVHAGWSPVNDPPLTAGQKDVNDWIKDLPRHWADNTFDAVAARAAVEHIRKHHPRVFYFMFGETDEWAHERRYDCYLDAAHYNDRWIAGLWEMIQADPQYAGKTTLFLTTDHGRGATPKDWGDHGRDTDGAEFIWAAVLGPDTPPLGVRKDAPVTQSQIAATLAAAVGEDYGVAVPKAALALKLKGDK